MSEDGRPISGAIWIALIGALATSGGYLFTYYRDISIQERRQKHDLVVKLLTEDSRESSKNLVWAHDAGLISLSNETIRSLKAKPYEGPTRSGGETSESTSITERISSEDIIGLVRGLDAETKSLRSQALQSLLNETAGSNKKVKEAIAASIAALSGERLEAISVTGRYNTLYFLDRVDWTEIDAQTRKKSGVVLKMILDRANEGLAAVGPQTRSLISSIRAKLA